MPKHIVLATIDDFLATFQDGREIVQAYDRACASYNPSRALYSESQRIADQLTWSRYTIRDWLSGRTKPKVVSQLERAVELGIFPDHQTDFDTTNPLFPAVNRLAAVVFWTGSLSTASGRYRFGIYGSEDQLRQQKSYFKDTLHLDMDVSRYNDNAKRGHELIGHDNTSLYARLLTVMGCPPSSAPTFLPKYVTTILADHPHQESIAGRTLQQFLRIGFAEKLHIKHMPTTNAAFFMRLTLHCHRTRQTALQYAREVAALVDQSLPGIFDDEAAAHIRLLVNSQKGNVAPYIAFNKPALLRMMDYHPSFLDIRRPEIVWNGKPTIEK